MYHDYLIRTVSIAVLAGFLFLAYGLQAGAAPSRFTLFRFYDFQSGPSSDWSGIVCDWVNFGGSGDGPSLIMVGGDKCIAGPYSKSAIYKVQSLWSGYFVDNASGSYRLNILDANYNLVQQSAVITASGGVSVQFPNTAGLTSFYVLFEHISGVSVHLDDIQIGWATDPPTPTPAPTQTPAATETPVATSTPQPTLTPQPTPTPTPTPEPWEDVDESFACGGRGWFNWLLCWLVPPSDTFAAVDRLLDFLFGKDPFVTVKRLADIRSAMIGAVQSGGVVEDISSMPAMIQKGLIFLFYDVFGQWRAVIQALFDVTAAVALWKYVTLRATT